MKTSTINFSFLLILLSFSLLPLLSSARPCKTLFITYTITTTTSSSSSASEESTASSLLSDPRHSPSRYFTIYRIITPLPRPYLLHRHSRPAVVPQNHHHHQLPLSSSSIQDRAKDILVVVAGLLFGVGCGAVTASTMYLVWSLFTNNHHQICADDDSDEDDAEAPKSLGYVMIADRVETNHKEGYEANTDYK